MTFRYTFTFGYTFRFLLSFRYTLYTLYTLRIWGGGIGDVMYYNIGEWGRVYDIVWFMICIRVHEVMG